MGNIYNEYLQQYNVNIDKKKESQKMYCDSFMPINIYPYMCEKGGMLGDDNIE